MAVLSVAKKAKTLFKKYEGNPILTRRDWPYPVNAVLNPGAVRLGTETLLLIRAEAMNGVSHLTVARSFDGFTGWQIDPAPSIEPDLSSREESGGLIDPRIVFLEEQKQFAITYISLSGGRSVVSLAITKNFRTFARLGSVTPPQNWDACLLPRRFGSRFALIHRPIIAGEAYIWISFSPDLKHWGDHSRLIGTRTTDWDCHRVGLACQPIETQSGWLLFCYGVCNTGVGPIYRVGLALLHLQEPWRVLRRSKDWILEPTELYERVGDTGAVVFPTGATVDRETGQFNLYYGTADCSVAVATSDLNNILDYITSCPKVE
jgi:predicted GH43/DUF377 family glycosyl hydrolase